jgi:hypothetical protein
MSALLPKADIRQGFEHVRFVPIADINHHLFSAVANVISALGHKRTSKRGFRDVRADMLCSEPKFGCVITSEVR